MEPWYAWSPWGGEFWFARFLVQRGVALTYLIAFLATVRQFRPLSGENGLLPIEPYVEDVAFRDRPSLFQLMPSERALTVGAWLGVGLSALSVLGIPGRIGTAAYVAAWATMWILYLSFVNVGQTFYDQGYEPLLCECGFLAIVLGAPSLIAPAVVIYLFRWVSFRSMFGAGVAKLRGDDCWRDLSCLERHYETQPAPNRLSWVLHRLPAPFHRANVLVTHLVELVVPFLYFGPPRVAALAGVATVGFQGWILLTGNFSFLNLLSIAIAGSLFADGVVEAVPSVTAPTGLQELPLWLEGALLVVVGLVIVLSVYPVSNMLSGKWREHGVLGPFNVVNTYGAFGLIRSTRHEIVVQGTHDREVDEHTDWETYEFHAKPTDPGQLTAWLPPYPYLLDSSLWWAARASSPTDAPWFVPFLERLLAGDEATLSLLQRDPFDEPPRHVRALRYRYEFTSFEEWRETGRWWTRERMGTYYGPISQDERH